MSEPSERKENNALEVLVAELTKEREMYFKCDEKCCDNSFKPRGICHDARMEGLQFAIDALISEETP